MRQRRGDNRSAMVALGRAFTLILMIALLAPNATTQAALSAGKSASPEIASTPNAANSAALLDLPSHTGRSPYDPPKSTDTTFVTDQAASLDRYLNRDQVPNGRLRFNIGINRYFSTLLAPQSVDSQGFIEPVTLSNLVNRGLLPSQVFLQLMIYDVDSDYTPRSCRELDNVEINGRQLQTIDSVAAELTSGSDVWSRWGAFVPIGWLKFPTAGGVNGQSPMVALNEIAIPINVNNCQAWALEVDWGALSFSEGSFANARPVLFAHGWKGEPSGFDQYAAWLRSDGIPSAGQPDLARGTNLIADTAPLLWDAVLKATREYGVDKVNIVAHSQAGLVTTYMLRDNYKAQKVDHVITLSSPHLGSDFPNRTADFGPTSCANTFSGDSLKIAKCKDSADELTAGRVRNINYSGCRYSYARRTWQGCEPRWVNQPAIDYRALIGGFIDLSKPERWMKEFFADVGAPTAQYPWNSQDWLRERQPDSNGFYVAIVDGEFVRVPHVGMRQTLEVYRCAIIRNLV